MGEQNILLPSDLWDRIENEITKQNRTKKDIAVQCGFSMKALNRNHRSYMCTLYFARLCSALKVSADYLLFGENNGGLQNGITK